MNENNETDQCDEIIALKSICGHNFHCDVEKRPIKGRLDVEIDIHDILPATVSCNFNKTENLLTLNYLSPLHLNFSLPPDYPSKSPPIYDLSCLWLTSRQILVLMKELDALWKANCNGVVLFNWLDALQNKTKNILNIKFPLMLTQDKISKLTEYDVKRREKEFCATIHECIICFSEKAGNLCTKFHNCGHIFCKDCLSNFLNVHINDGNVKSLNCLAEMCSSEIDLYTIKNLVDPETFERYDRLLLQKSLDSMADIVYCPRPWCGCAVLVDKQLGMGSCQACQNIFCISCKSTYHGINKCPMIPEEIRALVETYSEATENDRVELGKTYGKKMFAGIQLNEGWIKTNSKQCPKCKVNIEKNLGCNNMTCSRCNHFFCWLCLEELRGSNPFNHEHYSKKKSAVNSE